MLTSTLAGLVALHPRHRVTVRRPRAANHGSRWSPLDDQRLVERHRAGAKRKDLAAEFGRSPAGIRARLIHLGEINLE